MFGDDSEAVFKLLSIQYCYNLCFVLINLLHEAIFNQKYLIGFIDAYD